MRTRLLALHLIGLLLTSNWVAAAPPDLVVTHAKVVTVDPKFSIAEAFAVHEGRIVAVGKNDEILALSGDNTQKLNLGGKTVIPGLCDSHVHPTGAALYEYDHPIPEMDTIADVLKYIGGRAEALPDGEWIGVSQVFVTRLRDQRYPNRKELDSVAPKNPVVFSTGPDASLNSLALELSGIDKNFQITDGKSGQIEKDPVTGELTGILRSASSCSEETVCRLQFGRLDEPGRPQRERWRCGRLHGLKRRGRVDLPCIFVLRPQRLRRAGRHRRASAGGCQSSVAQV